MMAEDQGGFRDMRSTEERLFVEHHIKIETHQRPAVVHPAKSLMVGSVQIGTESHPHITIYAHCADFGLCFLPSADELETLGKACLKRAALMRAEADAQLAQLIERGRKG
jgi:hypothetical protein